MRRFLILAAPFIVLLAAWAAALKADSFNEPVSQVVLVLPYLLAGMALFMCLWLQNSNFFYLCCYFLFSILLIAASDARPDIKANAVLQLSILTPLNVIWLSFAKERGILGYYGRNKLIIVGAQMLFVFVNTLGRMGLSPNEIPENAARKTGLVIPATVLYILAIGLLATAYVLKRNYHQLVLAVILLSSYISLHFMERMLFVSLFTGAIFLIIIIALFDVSYSMAFYDTLTGILARRAMEQELMRLGGRYAIAMVDIDHFKRFNDTYGHDVGDEVLRMVAAIMERTSGRGKIFRYGGEEFAIIFHGQEYDEVEQRLETVRKAVESRPFVVRTPGGEEGGKSRSSKTSGKKTVSKAGEVVNITVSIGVAQKTEMLKTPYDVIRRADEALYKSKSNGRNCVSKS